MMVVHLINYGKDGVIKIIDAPKPKAIKGHVIVSIKAAGVNPADWKTRSGYFSKFMLPPPFILGSDFAGVITEIGPEVTNIKIGDEVYGQGSILSGGTGTFAEFALVNTDYISLKPQNTDFIQAGALPLAGVSAVIATEHINLKKGQKILIHGGGGGIGSIAIQVAKYIGAYVATTVGEKDIDFVKRLGADVVIDYRKEKFEEKLNGYDAVFDTVAGETYLRSFSVLNRGGIIVSMLEKPNVELMKKYEVMAIAQQTRVTSDRLAKLTDFVIHKVITPFIDRSFPLEKTEAALSYLEENHPTGKVVIITQ
jgi:NADPH:quinone reductase-like Zn-dependent oxidoreductase